MSEVAENPVDTGAAETTAAPDTTIVDAPDPGTPAPTPATWPDTWRELLAGEDEKLKARLKRFSDPKNVVKSWLEAEKKISSGQVVKPLSENPTEEELAAYRTANNIPEAWDKYDRTLSEGHVLGEDDKPIVDSFLQAMHGAHLPQQYVKPVLEWYYKFNDEQQQALHDLNQEARDAGMTELRTEWGNDFKGNLNAVRGFLDSVDEGLFDQVFGARGADGIQLGNNPTFIRAMVSAALAMNPAATLMPGSLTTAGRGLDEQIAEIETVMKTDRKRYDADEKMQAKLRDLYDARIKLQGAAPAQGEQR